MFLCSNCTIVQDHFYPFAGCISLQSLHQIFHANVLAPITIIQKVRKFFTHRPIIINLSSDAAANHYKNWGGYGASKAALDHFSQTLAAENPSWKVFAFDPGDMRTDMHQAAFPGEDISDRPLPEKEAVPSALELIFGEHPSGRYEAGKVSASV